MTTEPLGERLQRCQATVEQAPDSAAAHYNLGLAFIAKAQMHRAEQEFRAALAIDPDLVEAWVNLGGTQLLAWDFAAAAASNREALTRRPGLVEAHYNLGQAHLYMGEAKELVDCCTRVVELDSSHAAGYYFLAVGLLALDRPTDARSAVSRAMALGHRPTPEFLRKLEHAEAASATVHPVTLILNPNKEK